MTPWLNDWNTYLNDLLPDLGLEDVPNDHFTLGEPEAEINYWEKPWVYPAYDPGSLYDPDWMWNTTETIIGALEEESSVGGDLESEPDSQQTPDKIHHGSSSEPYHQTNLAESQHEVTPPPPRVPREQAEKQTLDSKTRWEKRKLSGGMGTTARKRAWKKSGGASKKRVNGRIAHEDTEAE